MNIGINARLLLPHRMEGIARFAWETTKHMILSHPKDRFVLFFDRTPSEEFRIAENVHLVKVFPQARHPILWTWWFEYALPKALKKNQIEVLYSPENFCSLRSEVPTLLTMHDITYQHFPQYMKIGHLSFYKKMTPRYLHRAEGIATVSQFTKMDLVQSFGLDPNKIHITPNGFTPKTFDKHPGKEDIMVYVGSIHPRKNVEGMLLAYDLFRRRLEGRGPKFFIVGRRAFKAGKVERILAKMKYGNDVFITGIVSEQKKWEYLRKAKIFIYMSKFEGFGIPVLEAMQAGTAILTSKESAMEEVAGDAALYANPSNTLDISEQLILMWENPSLRKQLVKKGHDKWPHFRWDKSSDRVYELLKQIKDQ